MASLAKVAENDEFVSGLLAGISPNVIAQGVNSELELIQRFPAVRAACHRLAYVSESGSMLDFAWSYLRTRWEPTLVGLVEGDSVQAILSRADYFVQRHDLDNVSQEPGSFAGTKARGLSVPLQFFFLAGLTGDFARCFLL